MPEVKELVSQVVDALRKQVATAIGPVIERLEKLERALAERKGLEPESVKKMVAEAVAEIPVPKDGASVSLEDVAPLIDAEVQRAVAAIPTPKDGISVTVDDVAPLVAAEVQRAVAGLPAPKDGVSPEPEKVAALLAPRMAEMAERAAEAAVEKIERPKDGKSVTVEDVAPLIGAEVERAVAEIPRPRDGVSPEAGQIADLLAPQLAEAAEKAALAAVAKIELPDVAPVVSAEVERAIKSIPAPKDGVDGKSVAPEAVQEMVSAAVAQAVAALPAAKNGTDGRDATLIEPMPSIDETRSYAKGTWAKHRGGLWVARQVTQGMVGWDCVVDGVAGVQLTQGEDLRSMSLAVECSSGVSVSKAWAMPVVIYRGIWKEGDEYAVGDSATRGGSTWILMAEQRGTPGEEGSGWQLAAKCGRNGRDGLKGEKGDRGAEGKGGRDLTQMDWTGQKF